jgi:hypothetical protein
MNEWIVRVLPLPARDTSRLPDALRRELARFRLRIIAPHDRPGLHPHGSRVESVDVGFVRILALDSANPFGGVGGSLDSDQCAWLVRELGRAHDRHVVVATYDGSRTMTSATAPPDAPPRVLGPEVVSILLAHRQVVAWVSGTVHDRAGRRHGDGAHGFWEIPGAAVGLGAPLAGGMSVTSEVRHLHRVVVMRSALAGESGPSWEVRDRLAADDVIATAPTVPAASPR